VNWLKKYKNAGRRMVWFWYGDGIVWYGSVGNRDKDLGSHALTGNYKVIKSQLRPQRLFVKCRLCPLDISTDLSGRIWPQSKGFDSICR